MTPSTPGGKRAPASARPRAFALIDVRLRGGPIRATVLLGGAVLLCGMAFGRGFAHVAVPGFVGRHAWANAWAGHLGLLVVGLAAIALVRRRIPGAYGLRRPEGKSYVGAAIAWGVAFGVLMTLVDFAPQLAARQPPPGPFTPLTPSNVAGWLGFEWAIAGTAEEVVFRGLLVSYLATRVSGRVRLFGREQHVAGLVVAILFALAHAANFWTRPFLAALGQQAYAFALALLYAYWLDRSRSVVAPIVGHDVSNGVEYVLAFVLQAAWG